LRSSPDTLETQTEYIQVRSQGRWRAQPHAEITPVKSTNLAENCFRQERTSSVLSLTHGRTRRVAQF
jgi:hypothetical protein